MSERVKMDWVLFWTILGLISLGLVMVYSTTALKAELKAPQDESAPAWVVAPKPPDTTPAANPHRLLLRRAGVLVLVSGFLFTLFRRYGRREVNKVWLLMGCLAGAMLTALIFFQDPTKAAHYDFVVRQALAALFGFLLLMILSQRDYRRLATPQCAFLALSIVIFLLIVVYRADDDAHRWLHVGVSLQPSELAKPALIVFLAWFVTLRGGKVNSPSTVWPAALALFVLGAAVAVADFGTALVLVVTAAAVFYLAGLNRRYTVTAGVIGLLLLAAAVAWKPLRLKRLIDFIDPNYVVLKYIDPERKLKARAESGKNKIPDTRYHGLQSTIAVGPGGIGGRGLMNGRQKLRFLPAVHTDYIFAVVAEELGMCGAAILLAGFMVILWRGYRLFLTAADPFGRYVAVGVTTTLVFQALLNISVVLDMGPSKGIPLPLISFGGSSIVSSLIMLGLLLSVSQRANTAN